MEVGPGVLEKRTGCGQQPECSPQFEQVQPIPSRRITAPHLVHFGPVTCRAMCSPQLGQVHLSGSRRIGCAPQHLQTGDSSEISGLDILFPSLFRLDFVGVSRVRGDLSGGIITHFIFYCNSPSCFLWLTC